MEKFEGLLKKIMETPTSAKDIFNIAGKMCNVFTYPEIRQFKDINQLFKMGNSPIEQEISLELPFDKTSVVILYKSGPNFGHWTMVKKVDDGYHFLCSYGTIVDDVLQFSDPEFNYQIGQDKNYLGGLLAKSGKSIYYNHNPLQAVDDDIATCGLYCALFLKHDNLSVDDFAELIKKVGDEYKMSNDMVVALLTLV